MRNPTDSGPDGVQGPRLANGSWEPRGREGLAKWQRRVLNRGQRRSNYLELTTFDEGVNVQGRGHGGTCDDREVGNWVGACRSGYKEGAGLWIGLDPGGSRLRVRGTGYAGRSLRGGGWGEVVGCLKEDRGWDGDRAG